MEIGGSVFLMYSCTQYYLYKVIRVSGNFMSLLLCCGIFKLQSSWSTLCYYCSKKNIAAGNFTVHEVHCIRNITLCPHCDDPVAKSDLDHHVAEQHTKVTCPHCSVLLMKSEIDQHFADAHATEPCPECGENIVKNLLEDHKRSVHSTTACPLCRMVIDKTALHQHQVFLCLCPT